MCGRARCSLAPQQAAAAAGVPEERWLDRDLYRPSHNLAPGAYLPTVELAHLGSVQEASGAAHGSGGAAEGAASAGAGPQLQMRTMAWGLVPSYTKPPPGGQRPSAWDHFNARSEAVSEGDGWGAVMRRLLARNRCVVLADGFYEWRKEGARKQPYYVHMKDGQVMRFAGVYDRWVDPEGQELYSVAILTTDSAKSLAWLHDRMPVVLDTSEKEALWLGTATDQPTDVLQLVSKICRPCEDVVSHPVTPQMSNTHFDGPEASEDIRRKKGSISNLFKAAASGKARQGAGGKASAAVKVEAAGEAAAAEPAALNTDSRPPPEAAEPHALPKPAAPETGTSTQPKGEHAAEGRAEDSSSGRRAAAAPSVASGHKAGIPASARGQSPKETPKTKAGAKPAGVSPAKAAAGPGAGSIAQFFSRASTVALPAGDATDRAPSPVSAPKRSGEALDKGNAKIARTH